MGWVALESHLVYIRAGEFRLEKLLNRSDLRLGPIAFRGSGESPVPSGSLGSDSN
jgi:hypothetical protein